MSMREREFGAWKGEAERFEKVVAPPVQPVRAAPLKVVEAPPPFPTFPGVPVIFDPTKPVSAQPTPTGAAMREAWHAERGDPRYKEYLDLDKSGRIDIYDYQMLEGQAAAREALLTEYGVEIPESMEVVGFKKEKVGEPVVVGFERVEYGVTPVKVQKYQYVVEMKPVRAAPSIAETIIKFDPYRFGAEIGAGLREVITGVPTPPHKITEAAEATKGIFVGAQAPLGARLDRPQDFLAGFVAVPESLAYTVGRFAGFETPTPPPTVGSALVTTGVGAVLTGRLAPSPELIELERFGPGYIAGGLAGEIAMSWLIGKGVAKGVTVVKRVTPKVVKGTLGRVGTQFTKTVGKAVSPVTRRLEFARFKASGWLAEHSAWYKERALRGLKHKPHLVSLPPKEPSLIAKEQVWSEYVKYRPVQEFFWKEPTYGLAEIWVTARPEVGLVARRVSGWAAATRVVSGVAHTPYAVTFGKQLERGGLMQQILSPTQIEYPVTLKTEFLPYIPTALPRITKFPTLFFGPTLIAKEYVAPAPITRKTVTSWERVFTPPTPYRPTPAKPPVVSPYFIQIQPPPEIVKPEPTVPFAAPIQVLEEQYDIFQKQHQYYETVTEQVARLEEREELIEFPREEYVFAPPPQIVKAPAPPRKEVPYDPFRRRRRRRKPKRMKGFLWGFREHPIREPEELVKGFMRDMQI